MTYYHVWFSPKNRKAILEGEVREVAREALLEVAQKNAIPLLECEMAYDHVHLLLEVTDDKLLPSVMQTVKGTTARRVFQQLPNLKHDVRHRSLWQRGYGRREVTAAELPRVRRYIRNHREDTEHPA